MMRYLISFDDGAMTFPDEDLPEVSKAAHEVVRAATDGLYPETKAVLGGFAIVDVSSREEALEWAARIACC